MISLHETNIENETMKLISNTEILIENSYEFFKMKEIFDKFSTDYPNRWKKISPEIKNFILLKLFKE